jgi:hypothetical protein
MKHASVKSQFGLPMIGNRPDVGQCIENVIGLHAQMLDMLSVLDCVIESGQGSSEVLFAITASSRALLAMMDAPIEAIWQEHRGKSNTGTRPDSLQGSREPEEVGISPSSSSTQATTAGSSAMGTEAFAAFEKLEDLLQKAYTSAMHAKFVCDVIEDIADDNHEQIVDRVMTLARAASSYAATAEGRAEDAGSLLWKLKRLCDPEWARCIDAEIDAASRAYEERFG